MRSPEIPQNEPSIEQSELQSRVSFFLPTSAYFSSPTESRGIFLVLLFLHKPVRTSVETRIHTYVSQMQALGVNLATIQSIAGHADMDMTMHYLHVQAPIREAAIEKFNHAFSNKKPQASAEAVDLQSCSQFWYLF